MQQLQATPPYVAFRSLRAARKVHTWLFAITLAACSGSPRAGVKDKAPKAYGSLAERIADLAGREALDYSDPDHWGCSPFTERDLCDASYSLATVVTDGTQTLSAYGPDPDAPVDCFYIYPTVDLSLEAGNHDDIQNVLLPRGVIAVQAAPFGAACRVFAPFYRQATIASYGQHPEKAKAIFLNAFADVAAAFEYYLGHWNNGRPVVVLGHSQGAQMASYLLHGYFDGDTAVTQISGSMRSSELRNRLVAAFPIGFNVFVPPGEIGGGSFSDLPLCASLDEPGCVTAYRSYPEGFSSFGPGSFGAEIDAEMAEAGLLHRPKDPADELACVNPATGPRLAHTEATGPTGQPVGRGDIRLLLGTWSGSYPIQQATMVPGRYAATCRSDLRLGGYLAISLHAPEEGVDQRGDPLDIYGTSANSPLGLHGSDYQLPMGDLVDLVRRKTVSYQTGAK